MPDLPALPNLPDLIPLQFQRLSPAEQAAGVRRFLQTMTGRRSVRRFAGAGINLDVIREAIRTAGAAPSGANLQPWYFVVVTDPHTRRAIRLAAEKEGSRRRAALPPAWLAAAPPLDKSYLEEAPCLIAVFRVNYSVLPEGGRLKHYYVHESVALAVSFLLAALQHAGVSTLVHAPVPALAEILQRPGNESPFLLIAAGQKGVAPAPGAAAPDPVAGAPDPAAGALDPVATARAYYERMRSRRVIRDFSPEPVPLELVQEAIAAAHTAPSGAGLKPWRFELVSDPSIKGEIRRLAEQEEKLFYETRITPEWRRALAPLGTDWEKPFIETAPHLIACFKVDPELDPATPPPYIDSSLKGLKPQYTLESAGIAAGNLIQALHHAGLACLTHTPSPMNFLRTALGRPANETPFLLLPVGYPAAGCRVPNISKKPLEQIMHLV